MKIRTIPKEYEATQFNGITKELEDFLAKTHTQVHKQGDGFILSNILGNQVLDIGDYLYKHGSPLTMVHIARKDHLLDEYFEVIE